MPPVDTKGLSVTDQGLADRLVGGHIGVDRAHEVAGTHRLVFEGEMNDAVGLSGRGRQTVKVVEIAAADLGTHGGNGLGRGAGAGESDNPVAVVEKFGDDGTGDMARGASYEYAH